MAAAIGITTASSPTAYPSASLQGKPRLKRNVRPPMEMFASESALLAAIDRHDELVQRCVRGEMSFWEFCQTYHDFYSYYALDGHESDEEERLLLEKHASRIEPHRLIAYEILGMVCSDDDAQLESYKAAGRFGSEEAMKRLRNVEFPA